MSDRKIAYVVYQCKKCDQPVHRTSKDYCYKHLQEKMGICPVCSSNKISCLLCMVDNQRVCMQCFIKV